jgi:ribosome hibernation promoting factor
MTLRVSGKNLDIGDALRQHVLEKVEATVARYFNGSVGGHVVVTREGSGYRSDCTLRLSSGISLHAEGRAHEPYLCFDQAADKIERRLRRYKTRLKGHLAATASERGKVANYLIEQPDEEEEEPAGGFNPVVVAEGTEELKSLSVASAVAELDLTGVGVVVFQHAGSGRVNIVYRRRDGAIGWVDPQAPRNPPRAD